MQAIRQLAQVKDGTLTLKLPASFEAREVEVIVLPASEVPAEDIRASGARRGPSPKLKGTRILGDIMAPVVPESDWDALK
jgi:hypothetical protein